MKLLSNLANSCLIGLAALLAIMAPISAKAQRDVMATLQKSDGTVTTYYGENALFAASPSIETGCVITLSPGHFKGISMNSDISFVIRGAGMGVDLSGVVDSTNITYISYTEFYSEAKVHIEDVCFNDGLLAGNVDLSMERCVVDNFQYNLGMVENGDINKALFVNCIFEDSAEINALYNKKVDFVNTCINNLAVTVDVDNSVANFVNCILMTNDSALDGATLVNSIVVYNNNATPSHIYSDHTL